MKTIEQILSNIRPEADFKTSVNYFDDALLDSLDMIRLVSDIDENFSISIDGSDVTIENFTNLEAIKQIVKKYTDQS